MGLRVSVQPESGGGELRGWLPRTNPTLRRGRRPSAAPNTAKRFTQTQTPHCWHRGGTATGEPGTAESQQTAPRRLGETDDEAGVTARRESR